MTTEAELEGYAENANRLFNDDISHFFDHARGPEDIVGFAEWRRLQSCKQEVSLDVREGTNRDVSRDVSFVILTPNPPPPSSNPLTEVFVYGRSAFFNESRWFNEGIRKALELGSRWIVVMSDDLYGIDSIKRFVGDLMLLDEKHFDTVWVNPAPSYYHSYWGYLSKRHPLEAYAGLGHRRLGKLYRKFDVDLVFAPERPISKPRHYYCWNRVFPRPDIGEPHFRMTGDFAVLSAEWCRKQGPKVLNETFCGWEDMDLSMRFRKATSIDLDFRIGSQVGMTIRPGMDKALRELFNLAIFNEYWRRGRYQ